MVMHLLAEDQTRSDSFIYGSPQGGGDWTLRLSV